jgi:hypothetical protein
VYLYAFSIENRIGELLYLYENSSIHLYQQYYYLY